MTYADYCYQILKSDSKAFDAVYEDYIINLIGVAGLTELRGNGLLEPCGIVLGRQLYTLCSRK
jgi:hypothetical protein